MTICSNPKCGKPLDLRTDFTLPIPGRDVLPGELVACGNCGTLNRGPPVPKVKP